MPDKGHLIQTVPFEKWLQRNYCGPACLAMVLNSWDETRSFSQQVIADEIYDSASQSTYNSELVLYPRTRGFESYSFQGSLEILKDLVRKDIPVIVLTKTIKQVAKGHYRVVIGFDEDEDQIIFHDPLFGDRKAMRTKTFHEGLGAGKGAEPVPVDDGRGPRSKSVPLSRPSKRPADLHQSGHGLLPEVGFREIDGAVGKGPGISRPGPVSPVQPGHGQPESKAASTRPRPMPWKPSAWTRRAPTPTTSWAWLTPIKAGCSRPSSPSAGPSGWPRKEAFIRKHYLQVRALYIEKARLEYNQKKEKSNEKNGLRSEASC